MLETSILVSVATVTAYISAVVALDYARSRTRDEGGAGILLVKGSKVLLLRRSSKSTRSGQWDLSGGRIESGESALEAAKREMREETGLVPQGLVVATVTVESSDYPYTTMVVRQRPEPGPPLRLNWEHDTYRWVTLDQALQLSLDPQLAQLIAWLQPRIGDFVEGPSLADED